VLGLRKVDLIGLLLFLVISSGCVGEDSSKKTYFNQGNTYYDLGDYSQAISNYDKVIELDPTEGLLTIA
jgi:tetratricopeptide (TPR) repeat protein